MVHNTCPPLSPGVGDPSKDIGNKNRNSTIRCKQKKPRINHQSTKYNRPTPSVKKSKLNHSPTKTKNTELVSSTTNGGTRHDQPTRLPRPRAVLPILTDKRLA